MEIEKNIFVTRAFISYFLKLFAASGYLWIVIFSSRLKKSIELEKSDDTKMLLLCKISCNTLIMWKKLPSIKTNKFCY